LSEETRSTHPGEEINIFPLAYLETVPSSAAKRLRFSIGMRHPSFLAVDRVAQLADKGNQAADPQNPCRLSQGSACRPALPVPPVKTIRFAMNFSPAFRRPEGYVRATARSLRQLQDDGLSQRLI
jgi:hypothetical protein